MHIFSKFLPLLVLLMVLGLAVVPESSAADLLTDANKSTATTTTVEFPGKISRWNEYERHDFSLRGRKAIVVVPRKSAEGNPWIWRARFFGHRPEVDLALLAKGWHLVYCDVSDLFGSPQAVEHWDRCYQTLTGEYHLAPKPVLEGMSRGGLIVFNWTARFPERVSCIYADAPVCDIKSWPGGRGVGKGSAPTWKRMLAAYEFESDDQAIEWKGNPVDLAKKLAATGIPLFVVTGDADDIVPMQENCKFLIDAWKKQDSPLQVTIKSGIGHKHGLDDPRPLIDFLIEHTNRKRLE